MNRQQGFTLVEVAIVMVIIGLILGSVIKAQELVANAKVKNMEMTFNSLAQAIYTYQERYSALPGDDDNAKFRFSFTDSVDGNHNNIIEGNYIDYNIIGHFDIGSGESSLAWKHLRAAGLITGLKEDDTAPINAFSGRIGIGSNQFGFSWVFIGFTNIPSEVCIIFEGRSDGNSLDPQTGRVRATNVDGLTITQYPTNPILLNLLFTL